MVQHKNLTSLVKSQITKFGDLRFDYFMNLCLFHHKFGYYKNKNAIGTGEDFITAPEVSSFFGEAIAIWLSLLKKQSSSIEQFNITEIGAGRGTLAYDISKFLLALGEKNITYNIVDTSNNLTKTQQQVLKVFEDKIQYNWYTTLEEFTEKSQEQTIFIANEFFDCLALRQLIKTNNTWGELHVGLNENNFLQYSIKNDLSLEMLVPEEFKNCEDGCVYEFSTATNFTIQIIAEHIKNYKGYGLFFDYGYTKPLKLSTIQSIYKHEYNYPLDNIGNSDLTAHVNFAEITKQFNKNECFSSPVITQKCFLEQMGIVELIDQAISKTNDTKQQQYLIDEYKRLCDINEMGALFKAFAVSNNKLPLTGFEKHDKLIEETEKNNYGLKLEQVKI